MGCRFIYTCALYFFICLRRCHSPCCYYSRYKDIVLERCSHVRTFIFGSIRLHFWLRVTRAPAYVLYVLYFCTSFSSYQNLINFVKVMHAFMTTSTTPSSPILRRREHHTCCSSSSSRRIHFGALASSSSSLSNNNNNYNLVGEFKTQRSECFSFKARISSSSNITLRAVPSSSRSKSARRDVSVAARWRFWRKTTKEEEDSPWWLMDEKAMKRFTDEGKEDVFRLRTTNLPGMSEDKMTPEGAAAGALLLGLAVWAFVIILKLLALVWGILYAGVKYSAIAAVLVLLGIAAL